MGWETSVMSMCIKYMEVYGGNLVLICSHLGGIYSGM